MIAVLAILSVVILSMLIIGWIASAPLLRTLTVSIDQWADSVQGTEIDPLTD